MSATFRAMKEWPGKLRVTRDTPKFKTGHTETLRLLDRELRMVGAVEPIVEIALHPAQFTRDGRPYSEAIPTHPGVLVKFAKRVKGKQGEMLIPLMFRCDTYTKYEANLRAIAIGLEDLRRIDRYGVTSEAGEQWHGFKALPPAGPTDDGIVTVEQAARFMADASNDYRGQHTRIILDPHIRRDAYRMAAAVLHPDASANHAPSLWIKLQAAKELLDRELGTS